MYETFGLTVGVISKGFISTSTSTEYPPVNQFSYQPALGGKLHALM
jgi:hypothetical protein